MKHQKPYRLKEIKIELTYRCPLSCIHCSSDSVPDLLDAGEMSIEKCILIIDEAARMGVDEISFSGGEPLLWEGLLDVVEVASVRIKNVCIYSSGNIQNIGSALSKLKQKGLTKLIFSVYSHEATDHERITRIRGSFDLTKYAMKVAQELDIRTELHFVALKQNYQHLTQIAELGKAYGISKISVLRFVPQGRGVLLNNSTLDRIDNIKLKSQIVQLRRNGYGIRTGSPFNYLLINKQPNCLSAIDRLIIAPDLRIYPCDAFKNILAEEIVGNLKYSTLENESLLDCWERSPYLNAIRSHLSSDFEEPCKSCSVVSSCLSGCLAQKVIAYGGLVKKPDPSCLMSSSKEGDL